MNCTGLILSSLLLFQSGSEPWLQEVQLIISKRENSQFQNLTEETARDAFVANFWKRRDPDPSTERNEAREEHYRRLHASERFRSGGQSGWKTDRGRIYVIHGEPDQRLVFASQTVRVTNFPSSEKTVDFPESELWTYYGMRHDQAAGVVDMLFVRGGDPQIFSDPSKFFGDPGSSHMASPFPTGSSSDFRLTWAGSPQFSTPGHMLQILFEAVTGSGLTRQSVFNVFDTLEYVSFSMEPSGETLERREEVRRQFKEQIESAVFFGVVETSLRYWYLRSPSSYVYIPIAIHVPGSSLTDVQSLAVLVELRRDGKIVAHFNDTLTTKRISEGTLLREGITYQGRVAVLPGSHRLRLYVLDREGHRIGRSEHSLDVPELDRNGFSISGLILCRNVAPAKHVKRSAAAHKREWLTYSDLNPLKVDDYLLLPAVDSRFRRKDQLTAFFEIYHPSVEQGRPKVQVSFQISRNREVKKQSVAHVLDYLTEGSLPKISYAATLPLATLEFGEHRLLVYIQDLISGETRTIESVFEVF